jgi:hypothetical protein
MKDTNDQTPGELLSKFYSDNGLEPDGGQSSSSVKIEMASWLHFYIPNFDARRKAVIRHDIHHLVTGYSTDISGESEISAWEIASGCRNYPAAFFINTSGLMMGIPLNLKGVLKAFARGRRTKNLYHASLSAEEAMNMKVSELKELLLLNEHRIDTKPRITDFLLLAGFALYGAVFSILSFVLLPFVIVYSVYTSIAVRQRQA